MYWDPTYILVLIGAVISGIASINVKKSFSKYSKVANSRGMTGYDAAYMILRSAGITDVKIEPVAGSLTDYYSPAEKVLKLSESVYGATSVAALGVAAHECGHAIQHDTQYGPLKLRSASVPVAKIGSAVSWPVLLIGLLFGWTGLARIGVILFFFVVLFQLVTLPVEFNASNRAMKVLEINGMLTQDELHGARKVLKAAALTYVAALFTTIMQFLRMLALSRSGDRD